MDQRLKGQEVAIRLIDGSAVVDSVESIGSFNDEIALELKEAGYLGEFVNRFDEILNGYGGNFEFNVNRVSWNIFVQRIIDKAQRRTPQLRFNVIRTDLYPNGESIIYTYADVSFGAIPTTVASRGDYVKVSVSFKCSERPVQINNLP